MDPDRGRLSTPGNRLEIDSRPRPQGELKPLPQVRNIIAVGSGKGGWGNPRSR